MKKSGFFGLFLCVACFQLDAVQAIPIRVGSLNQVVNEINGLKLRVNNHEVEINQIQEKFSSIDATVDSLRKQATDAVKLHRDQIQISNISLDNRLSNLETVSKGLVSDIQTIKSRLNEALADYKQQLSNYDRVIAAQGQAIDKLQNALKTVTELLQTGEDAEANLIYTVKPGDSLEKIANTQGSSIKAIKEANQLTTDRIRVGQKLKIPTK